jgi:hypothetical protein
MDKYLIRLESPASSTLRPQRNRSGTHSAVSALSVSALGRLGPAVGQATGADLSAKHRGHPHLS